MRALVQRGKQVFAGVSRRLVLVRNRLNTAETTRVDSAVAWLSRSEPGRWLVNSAAELTLFAVKGARSLKRRLRGQSDTVEHTQEALLPGFWQEKPRVLLLVEPTIPQCFHYRVQQKLDQFNALGWHAEWQSWSDTQAACERMHFVDCVIFYRAPGFPRVLDAIETAKALGKLVCYDVDDLIFDREQLQQKFSQNSAQLSDKDLQDILNGVDLYRSAIQACPYAIASTPALQQQMAELVEKKHCFLLPNGLDDSILSVADLPAAPRDSHDKKAVTIFYGSGTKTHDEDFALIAQPLARLMEKHKRVRLVIVGHLTLPEQLQAYSERVQRLPLMDFSSYLYSLRQADIAVAPLEPGLFADCKSEIKWLEAAAMGVPSVVSATKRYSEVVGAEVGLLAESPEQWFTALEQLVTDSEFRSQIASAARDHVLRCYGPAAMVQTMQQLMHDLQQQAVDHQLLQPSSDRQRVLLVNVLYPPQAMGGATKVLVDQVKQLRTSYSEQFDLSVLTCEVDDEQPYTLREYVLDGVNITVIKVPYRQALEVVERDDKVLELCLQWLPQCRPDVVHCHSMQRLTGSVLQAARQLAIPYIVTLHDAWWLSEHQFLLDANQDLVDPLQLNPLVATRTASDPARAVDRTRYLAEQLQHAQMLLAVSEYQADLYRSNGFTNVVVHCNAVARSGLDSSARVSEGQGRLRIGYLGGVSEHKGYGFLKRIVEQNQYAWLSFVMVDVFRDSDFSSNERWGQSEVELRGKVSSDAISEFYGSIDVLIAPSIWPESFGLVTREAALHGVWVVAADAGGLAEDIVNDENGFVFPIRDSGGCAAILQRMNDNSDYYLNNRPDIQLANQKINTPEQHTAELVEHYQQTLV